MGIFITPKPPSAADHFCQLVEELAKIASPNHVGEAVGVKILPVSKGQSISKLKLEMMDPRLPKAWGENYEQELLQKSHEILGIEWHFLGTLQSRKIPKLCEIATVLHTVSRLKELEIIALQSKVPNFFIQVNIAGEAQKNGCEATELGTLLEGVSKLKLEKYFLGLMGIPSTLENSDEATVRFQFETLRLLRDRHCSGKLLNMGMSEDYKIAIEEGSNLVRIGSAIFGARARM